jgi:hypothetical protein
MTLAVQTVRELYNGNGSTVDFNIPFSFESNGQVQVILVSSADVETTQVITTHYTISGSTVTMITAPASGQKLLVRMNKDLKQQEFNASISTPFVATDVESGLDYIGSLVQQVNEIVARCVKLPKSASLTNPEIPRTLADGDVLVWDEDEEKFIATSTDELRGVTVNGTEIQEVLSGTVNGSNTAFTTSQTPIGHDGFKLYRSGVLLIRGTHYSRVGTAVTMVTAPTSPQFIHAVYWYVA